MTPWNVESRLVQGRACMSQTNTQHSFLHPDHDSTVAVLESDAAIQPDSLSQDHSVVPDWRASDASVIMP